MTEMKTLDDVKPDIVMKLTENLDRLFKVEGCDPACHACQSDIEMHQEFKLASTPDGRDVMLCEKCTMPDFLKADKKEKKEAAAWKKLHPGFSRVSQ